jgi:CRISPR-associated endonuclease Csn1
MARQLENTVLGLDLGSNSIGWALIDEKNKRIVNAGVRIFPEGVDRDKQGGELSKNESRRIARGMRRQIRRRAKRKRLFREELVLAGLFPAEESSQQALLQQNPYLLRAKALDVALSPLEIGRVLIHLNQRRGFLSNKKADREKKADASKMLAEISELAKEIETAGHRTLGEHFAKAIEANPLSRVRGKHTRRDMFLAEFEAIWSAQQKHHPQLLTDELKLGKTGVTAYPRKSITSGGGAQSLLAEFGLFGLIFFQRPIYWPKSVVGQCELDPKQKRCPRADRIAQRFRILLEVNNLRVIAGDGEIKELTLEQREKLLKLLAEKKELTFDEIRKRLGLLESHGFNLEEGNRKKLLGMATDAQLAHKSLFGKAWHEMPEAQKNAIVRSLIHDDEETFVRRAQEEWHIDCELTERLSDVSLPEGYASYGRETLERLLPYVEQGLPLMTRDSQPCAIRKAGFLPPWDRPIKQGNYLPEPPNITNPLVRQALYEVRKLINAIIREHGKPTAIHIELAREVKGTETRRREMTEAMRSREARRDKARQMIEQHGEKATHNKINRYLLWEEQEKVCMYSGRSISIQQLLGGEADVDHILPYPRSLDDSLMNKAVCFRTENNEKGNQTVYEWLANKHPEKYEQVLQRAARLPIDIRNRKRPRFSQKSCELE